MKSYTKLAHSSGLRQMIWMRVLGGDVGDVDVDDVVVSHLALPA